MYITHNSLQCSTNSGSDFKVNLPPQSAAITARCQLDSADQANLQQLWRPMFFGCWQLGCGTAFQLVLGKQTLATNSLISGCWTLIRSGVQIVTYCEYLFKLHLPKFSYLWEYSLMLAHLHACTACISTETAAPCVIPWWFLAFRFSSELPCTTADDSNL